MDTIPNILPFKKQLIEYLNSIEVQYPNNNRFEQSFIEIESAINQEKINKRDFSKEADIRHAVAELNELRFIVENLPQMNIPIEILKVKFTKILSGERPVNKKSLNIHDEGRNVIFELSLATYIYSKGINIEYENGSDIVVYFEDKIIAIECKRINGEPRKSLKGLLRDAHRQLLKRKNHVSFGLIAININSVYFNEGKLLVAPNEVSTKLGFDDMLKKFIHELGELWQRRNIIDSADFVPAILVCLNGTVYTFENNLTANAFFMLANNTSNDNVDNFEIVKKITKVF